MSTKVNVFTKPAAASCAAPALSFAKADKAAPLPQACQPAAQPIRPIKLWPSDPKPVYGM